MAPPSVPLRHYADESVIRTRHVSVDTPPDYLQGSMKLKVTLPSGKETTVNVHRSTPMMDVLVQVTSSHKINPGNHAIRVICNNRNINYKPSTAVGSLDTSAIEIIRKTSNQEGSIKEDKQSKDKKVRLKVNLPRNQLAVYRLPPKTLIAEVLSMICEDKNLEEDRYEIRHPVNVDERLRGSCSLSDYQLQEVCIVPKNYRAPPLSVNDLFAMSSLSHHHEDRKRRGFRAFFSRRNKNTGNSSLSSGSTGDRSDSPENESTKMQSTSRLSLNVTDGIKYRANEQKIFRPSSLLNLNKVSRKRPAPLPPPGSTLNGTFTNGSSATTSCQNLSVDDDQRTFTPSNSELEDEIKSSSRSSSRNMNSPIGGPTVPSRIKRKAPLPPQATAQREREEVVSSHDKESNISQSPDLQMFDESVTRSTSPSEVSIDVRPSSSDVSDVILEESEKEDAPLGLIISRSNSIASNSSSICKELNTNEYIQQQLEDTGTTIPKVSTVSESPKSTTPETPTDNSETIIKMPFKSNSIDEENSPTTSLETLDEVLDKAEADLNKSRDSLSDFVTTADIVSPPENTEDYHPLTNDGNDDLLFNEENYNVSAIEKCADFKLLDENYVTEAVNGILNCEDKIPFKEKSPTRVKFKDTETRRSVHENAENQTLVFNFLENNSDKIVNNNFANEHEKNKWRDTFITELESSLSPSEEPENMMGAISASNYNVILKMKSQSKPRNETGRKSPSTESTSSYYSFKTESETKSRSNTDASFESVPPPLPSQPIPELSEFDDDRSVYSIVSSASSNDASPSHREDSGDISRYNSDAKARMFSISTYTNRDQKRSYTKRITRSESLQEISRPLAIDKIEARTSSLQRNQSVKSDDLKNNIKLNSNEGSNSLERSYRYGIGNKETFERTPKIVEEGSSSVTTDEYTKTIKPVVPLRVSKWYQEFHKEYIGPRNQSNLRKTKSIADIRMNDGQSQAGAADPGLAQEYMKLQNDFMKWQNQLMQNQNVLHSKVAPIAAPNMVMGQPGQPIFNMEPEAPKRREINIPIKMEGDNDSFMNQTSSFSTTNTMRNGGNNGIANNLGNQSDGLWNAPSNISMGSWKERPSNVECVLVTDPPQVFQAPEDPRFMPVFIRQEMNPSAIAPGFLPNEPVFSQPPQFEIPPTVGMSNQFGGFPNRQPQFIQENSQFAPQTRFNDSPAANNFQIPQSRDSGMADKNSGNQMPRFSNSQMKPSFNPEPIDRDESNLKFTSVINLSNEHDPNKGKLSQMNNVSPAPNGGVSEANTFSPNKQPAWRNNSNSGVQNRSNNWKKSPSPDKVLTTSPAKDSFTPMSSRLVQAASNQPNVFDSRPNQPSNYNNGPSSNYTQFKPAQEAPYVSNYSNNSVVQQPSTVVDSRSVVQPPPNFEQRSSPKLLTFDSRPPPAQQTFPPMPKFEPPPSFESDTEPMRISPPRRQKKSPSPLRQDVLMQTPRSIQATGCRSSPIRDQLSDSFANMQPPSAVPDDFQVQNSVVPPPPAPPCDVPPPPPPPPPRMHPEIRRTSTGKKIYSSNQAPELDAREELMMAIRKFGGSSKLRKTGDEY